VAGPPPEDSQGNVDIDYTGLPCKKRLCGSNIGSSLIDKAHNRTRGHEDEGNKDNSGSGEKTCSAETLTTTTDHPYG
jgi:hypothetical protein